MAQIDNGPATGNGVLPFQLPGGPVTTGIEVHVPLGTNPLPPSAAPFVDPGQAGTNIAGNPVVALNKTVTFGLTGATSVIVNPA